MATRIKLRPLRSEDCTDMARLANDYEVWRNLRDLPFPYTEADARDFIDSQLYHADLEQNYVRAIIYRREFVGMIGLHRQPSIYRFSAEIGYWLGRPYWGKGIASAAVAQMTTYGFKSMKLKRIYAGVFGSNVASQRVLEKCSYTKEGIARSHIFKDGDFYDEHRFAVVR